MEQELLNRLSDLDNRFRAHKHKGLDSEELNRGMFYIPVSYETNEIASIDLYAPFGIKILRVRGRTTKVIAATDNATTTVKNSAGTTMATITFPASTAIDQDATAQEVNSDNQIAKDSKFTLTQAKTTAGGKAIITIEYQRL